MSAAVIRLTPAPTHAECTAAITGFAQCSSDEMDSWNKVFDYCVRMLATYKRAVIAMY